MATDHLVFANSLGCALRNAGVTNEFRFSFFYTG